MHISFCDQQIEEIDLERFGGEEDRKTLSLVKSLDLSRNHIHRLSNLQTFTSLNILNISRNKLRKLSGLPLGLTKLDVSHNLLTKLIGIEILSSLQELNASYNHINHTYNVFITLGNLTSLNLSNNHIKQLDGMEHLAKLVDLNVMNNEISSFDSIRGLANLRNLQHLKIKGNPIAKHSNYVHSLSNLVPSLVHVDHVDLNSGLVDELESVASTVCHSNYTTTAATTSDEDSEYSEPSSLRARRRFSFQSDVENMSTCSAAFIKRPETPQGRIQRQEYQPLQVHTTHHEKLARPSSAPKRSNASSSYVKRSMNSFRPSTTTNASTSLNTVQDPSNKTVSNRELDDVKLVLTQQQQENSRLEKVNENLRGEITSLKSTIKTLQQDCDTFKSSNENILMELESLRTRYDRMQRNYRNVQQLYKEEKQKRITSDEGRNELQKQVSKMRVALHHHKSRLDIEHKEKTHNYDMLKEQHEQTKQDLVVLLEYVSIIEQRSFQQQQVLDDITNLIHQENEINIKESITASLLSTQNTLETHTPEMTERVKNILENYQPERLAKKSSSRMKGNPNVRNFNELRHLVHPQANSSTYKWETTLRNNPQVLSSALETSQPQHPIACASSSLSAHHSMKKKPVESNSNSSHGTPSQLLSLNHSSHPTMSRESKISITKDQSIHNSHTKHSPTITIPSVSPEKKPSSNIQKDLGSSQILKIIEEQNQNLITQLKSNESFSNSNFEEKAELLSTLNDLTRVDVSSSHENLYSFSPKDKNTIETTTYLNHTNMESSDSTLSTSDRQDPVEVLSKMSPSELQQLLAELSHQYSTHEIPSQAMFTTTTTSALTSDSINVSSNNNPMTDRDSSSLWNDLNVGITPKESDITLTRDVHFPSPEKQTLTSRTSPYKNEREMIVKQRLHERLALERKKMGVGGLDL
ncbi:hypothetical protein C9374_001297 [Naegleria lovaniensis]|uniref:Uncharacterized protein n=1 Tax=Naegleria lovaniensis TaxID=51637 RepID=A0AA88GXW5_NAELO|nr:uncharacterized protein C9374_001297 [Naegleria lovaniensis]KAG2387703.1 hypothetical protein C9374_001297 [Naegleria lovaniensis]